MTAKRWRIVPGVDKEFGSIAVQGLPVVIFIIFAPGIFQYHFMFPTIDSLYLGRVQQQIGDLFPALLM